MGFVCLLALVWMTRFFGYTYIRMLAEPKSSPPSSPTPSVQEQNQLNLAGFEFWTCQIGVFRSEENAQEEKARLDQLGWDAQIVSTNPWVLGIGYDHSQEKLQVIREQLKEGGIVSVPKKIQIAERAYVIRGNGAEQTARALQAVQTYLRASDSSREEAISALEKEILIPAPKGLSQLQEAGLLAIKAERTLPEDARRIVKLRLLAAYQATLEELKSN